MRGERIVERDAWSFPRHDDNRAGQRNSGGSDDELGAATQPAPEGRRSGEVRYAIEALSLARYAAMRARHSAAVRTTPSPALSMTYRLFFLPSRWQLVQCSLTPGAIPPPRAPTLDVPDFDARIMTSNG